MAVIPLRYNLANNTLYIWQSITERGLDGTTPISTSVDKLGNLEVWNEIVEDYTLNNTYKFSRDGKLHVPFFQEGYPPIPLSYVSGTITFDDFNSYTAGVFLDGLNSGSNEWNHVSLYGAYFARNSWFNQVMDYDSFAEYSSGSKMYPSLLGKGVGKWLENHEDWYGKQSFPGTRLSDDFESYVTGSPLSGSNGGTVPDNYLSWSSAWNSKTLEYYGLLALETFEEYDTGSNLNGLSGSSDPRYLSFSGSWRVVNLP